jgi:nitrate/nitrite-specific signal transduction histidine kinase
MDRRRFLRDTGGLCAAALLMARRGHAGSGMPVAAALNKSGRQRMLSQRIAKAWVMLGMNILPERARAILTDSLAVQQGQFAELKGFTPNDDVRTALVQLESEWAAYRTALAAAPHLKNAQRVYDTSESVQERAHRLTLAYERASSAPAEDRLINVAGRQRMLSQRLAKFTLFRAWDVNPVAARMEANFSRAEFSSGMRQLYLAAGERREFQPVLDQLDDQWVALRNLLETSSESAALRRAAPQVAEMSEHILDTTERLVGLFEAQGTTPDRYR